MLRQSRRHHGKCAIAASIGILIVHTPPYQPKGRGKIERFFRSMHEQFPANLDPEAFLPIEQLDERLSHWLDTVYHRRAYSFTNGSALDLLRQIAVAPDLAPAHFRGDLVRRITDSRKCKRTETFRLRTPAKRI